MLKLPVAARLAHQNPVIVSEQLKKLLNLHRCFPLTNRCLTGGMVESAVPGKYA
jgi:hypothetical protein